MRIRVAEVSELGLTSEEVCEFYKENWEKETVLSIPSFYQWQFVEYNDGHDYCIAAVDEGTDKLCGVMGLNKRSLILNGSEINAAELTTWVVNKKYIGKGIGPKILKEVQCRYDAIMGTGLTDMALAIYMRCGVRCINAIPRYIKVFDFDKIAPYSEYTHLAKKLAKQWIRTENEKFTILPFNKKHIKIIENITLKRLNFFCRNYEYLEWRYSNHPVFQYDKYLIRTKGDSSGKGCIVCTRLDRSIQGFDILHVMDCFGDPADMQAAVSFIHEFCLENNIHVAEFYCISTAISKFFVTSGWFSINDDIFFQFPHFLHPVELKRPPTTSFGYWSRKNFVEMNDIGKLYVSRGDVDLDRPTAELYRDLEKSIY